MRIISKFSDYYDSVQAYGMDKKVIYKRKTEEFECNSIDYANMMNNQLLKDIIPHDQYGRTHLYFDDTKGLNLDHFYLIFFCGNIFPCFVFTYKWTRKRNWDYDVTDHYYCYSMEDILDLVKKKGSKKQKKSWETGESQHWFIYYGNNQKRIPMIFKDVNYYGNDKNIFDLHYKLGVPVFCYSEYERNSKIILNPELKSMKFYKVKDVYQTFQDISMFISGVLGGQSPPMIEISDKVRKAKHGFDKWSFKKHKETK